MDFMKKIHNDFSIECIFFVTKENNVIIPHLINNVDDLILQQDATLIKNLQELYSAWSLSFIPKLEK